MKFFSLLVFCVAAFFSSLFSQQTKIYNDPQIQVKLAKDFFQKEEYSLAYPIFKNLQKELAESSDEILTQEIQFYNIVCGLKQNEAISISNALDFIALEKNNARVQQMQFHLAEYYYRQQNFAAAVPFYEASNIANLSNRQIGELKFHKGYSYFVLQRFSEAIELFNSVRQIKESPNYAAANYYYGFLSFKEKKYASALESFKLIENEKEYETIVPYYIAQLLYLQGEKKEALSYAELKIKSEVTQFYLLEFQQLLGHGYFELGEFGKVVIYLEEYVNKAPKITRENLYELSYAYFQTRQFRKAVEGFKQLGGKEDSLSQHAMYLLGDSYLKVGEKSNSRNAFLFCASNSSNSTQKEISKFNYAKLSYELGYEEEALKSLNDFLNKYTNSIYTNEAKDLLVAVLANNNNYKESLSLLESMDEVSGNSKIIYPKILFGRATELINDGNLEDANALLDKALKTATNKSLIAIVNFWKGEIVFRKNQFDDAILFYNKFLTTNNSENGDATVLTARYNLGYCYFQKTNYEMALKYFEAVTKTVEKNNNAIFQDAILRSGDCYFMNRSYEKAKVNYAQAINNSWPAADYALFQTAMISGIKNSTDKINLLNELIQNFPSSNFVADANMELANTFLADENFRNAITYLNEVLKLENQNNLKPAALLKLGIAYYNLNNNKEALKQYKDLVQLFPNSLETEDAQENIKAIYVEEGKSEDYFVYMREIGKPLTVELEDSLTWKTAFNLYENENEAALTSIINYLEKFPNGINSIEANFLLGEIYSEQKDISNALKVYEEVAKRAPNKFAEDAMLQAARIYFFEKKNYEIAESYYEKLKQITGSQEIRLEALRGLLRSQFQQKKWNENNAKELIVMSGSSADDKALANIVFAKIAHEKNQFENAIENYKIVIVFNKAALAAEARYEIANCFLLLNNIAESEKAAFEVIKKSGSYNYWVTKAYVLLGDIYFKQKDYFNAKATYQSVVDNSNLEEIKMEAQTKLNAVIAEEKKISKIGE